MGSQSRPSCQLKMHSRSQHMVRKLIFQDWELCKDGNFTHGNMQPGKSFSCRPWTYSTVGLPVNDRTCHSPCFLQVGGLSCCSRDKFETILSPPVNCRATPGPAVDCRVLHGPSQLPCYSRDNPPWGSLLSPGYK